jgi:hypothetical protein
MSRDYVVNYPAQLSVISEDAVLSLGVDFTSNWMGVYTMYNTNTGAINMMSKILDVTVYMAIAAGLIYRAVNWWLDYSEDGILVTDSKLIYIAYPYEAGPRCFEFQEYLNEKYYRLRTVNQLIGAETLTIHINASLRV